MRLAEDMEYLTRHDPLTGLPNRKLLAERIADALGRLHAGTGLVGVFYADLDRFQVVNDGFGHAVGDEILRSLATRIEERVQPGDTLGRFAGDSFVLVTSELDGEAAAMRVAGELLAAISEPVTTSAGGFTLSASVGIALTDGVTSAEDLLREADTAMHRAKEHGGNGHRRFEPEMWGTVMQEVECGRELRLAIASEALRLHYQPVVELSNGRVLAFEALVRWDHPELGLLGPDEFVPAAERSAVIHPLGRWALRAACRQIAAWAPQAPGPVWANVAVNVSARQLCDSTFAAEVAGALSDAGVPAHRLALEVTETALMDAPEAALQTLREIKSTGVRILLDDFGTGHSSLGYLSRLPVDAIKLDRSFISGPEAAGNLAIVEAVAGMAQSLGLHLVGEGVETPEQAARLASVGCEFAQGYFYARPMTGEAVAAWVGAHPAVPAVPAPAPVARLRAFACLETPLPGLAHVLACDGDALLIEAGSGLYEPDACGWFAAAPARPALRAWLRSVAQAAAAGSGENALMGTEELLQTATRAGASLLEISLFVDRVASLASARARHAKPTAPRTGPELLFGQIRRRLLVDR